MPSCRTIPPRGLTRKAERILVEAERLAARVLHEAGYPKGNAKRIARESAEGVRRVAARQAKNNQRSNGRP